MKRTIDINGTCLQGYITISYNTLVKVFGKPCIEEPTEMDKVGYEWKLLFDDGTIATIYDWKRYTKTPINKEEPFTWNVGGHSSAGLEHIQDYLKQNLVS